MRVRMIIVVGLLLTVAGCKRHVIPSRHPHPGAFHDDFDRETLGPDWQSHNPDAYRIVDGKLHIKMAHNQPLWLTRPIPRDVRIDVDCTPKDAAIDMKVEVFGDGQRHESAEAIAKDLQYTASGYVFIFGGWHNHLSTLVRQQEHQWQYDKGVPVDRKTRGIPGHTYHWTITRKGHHVAWEIDGKPFLKLDDPNPLEGPGHDRFAFDGWESEVVCDNLKIVPLE